MQNDMSFPGPVKNVFVSCNTDLFVYKTSKIVCFADHSALLHIFRKSEFHNGGFQNYFRFFE